MTFFEGFIIIGIEFLIVLVSQLGIQSLGESKEES